MLLPEVTTCQRMAVPNQNFRGVDHPAAMVQPAVTEFSVLTRCTGKGCVKTAHLEKAFLWQGQVVRGKKLGPVVVGIIVMVKVIDEYLTGG